MSGLELVSIAAKFALYVGMILAAGSPLLRLTVLPAVISVETGRSRFDAWLVKQVVVGVFLTFAASIALYLLLQLKMAGGDPTLAFAPDFIGIGAQTAVGQSVGISLIGCAVAAMSLVFRHKWLAALGALILVSAFTLQGHTMSIPLDAGWPVLGRVLLSLTLLLHLLIASWWFAVLIPLQVAAGQERDQAARCFGEWAIKAVPVLLTAGIVLFLFVTEFQLDGNDLYQQRMGLKILGVVCVLTLAAMNKLWLTGKPGLAWSLRIETLAASAVLMATAWLTSTGPGME